MFLKKKFDFLQRPMSNIREDLQSFPDRKKNYTSTLQAYIINSMTNTSTMLARICKNTSTLLDQQSFQKIFIWVSRQKNIGTTMKKENTQMLKKGRCGSGCTLDVES